MIIIEETKILIQNPKVKKVKGKDIKTPNAQFKMSPKYEPKIAR